MKKTVMKKAVMKKDVSMMAGTAGEQKPILSGLRRRDILLSAAEGLAAAAVTAWLFYDRPAGMLATLPLGLCLAAARLNARREACRRQIDADFRLMLDTMSSAVRAGLSAERAFAEAVHALRESRGDCLMTRAAEAVTEGLRLNRPVEVLFRESALTAGSEAMLNFADVFGAVRRSGGPLSAIMAETASMITARIETEREIALAVAEKDYERQLVTVMPLAFIAYLKLSSPGFLDVLYGSAFGMAVMTVCLLLYAAAVFWCRRIMAISI